MRTLIVALAVLAFAACDKSDPDEVAGRNAAGTNAAAQTTSEAVDDLMAKLPKETAEPKKEVPVPEVQFHGKFGTNGAQPTPQGPKLVQVDPKAVAELNLVAHFRIESAFAERQVDPSESIIVQLGGEEDDGLLVTVRYQGRTASRHVVPATNGPELVSNLDHTMDRLLDELGIPRSVR